MENLSTEMLPLAILYVEDEPEMRRSFSHLLQRRVQSLRVAENGQEGLERFRELRPDIIITDIRMPVMDGLAMIGKIRESAPDIPIIITSAFEETIYLRRAIDLGVAGFIPKPVSFPRLFQALKKTASSVLLERKVHEEHQYYEALMKSAIVSKTDPSGVITFVNNYFCDISGYSRKELVGQPHNVVRHPEMEKSIFRELWQTIQAKKIWRGRIKNRKKEGGFYIVDVVIIPLLDEDGEIREYLSIRHDITELETLRSRILEEEERNREQKRERRTMEEVAKAKDSFLVVFTHELKTPLNAIINFTDYVARQLEKNSLEKREKIQGLLAQVKENALFMLETVTDMLDVARIKAGKIELHITRFDPVPVIRGVLDRFGSLVRERKVKVKLELEEGLFIRGDEVRFSQIVSNLFSNAIKYGDGRILIRLEHGKGGGFLLSIEDNGEGIREKTKVFDLFEQGESNDIKRTAKGTGVGLHMVRLLCDEMGYRCRIGDSERLGGAAVYLETRSSQ